MIYTTPLHVEPPAFMYCTQLTQCPSCKGDHSYTDKLLQLISMSKFLKSYTRVRLEYGGTLYRFIMQNKRVSIEVLQKKCGLSRISEKMRSALPGPGSRAPGGGTGWGPGGGPRGG